MTPGNPDGKRMEPVFTYLPDNLRQWLENQAWQERLRTSQYLRKLVEEAKARDDAKKKAGS